MRKSHFILTFILILLVSINGLAQPHSKVRFGEISISTDGLLKWETFYKGQHLKGHVEQFRWNKWIVISSFESLTISDKKGETMSDDTLRVFLSTGQNKFRIVIAEPSLLTSTDITLNMGVPPSHEPGNIIKTDSLLDLGYTSHYEVFDENGRTMLHGEGAIINVHSLPKGVYYLSLDKGLMEFIKK